MVEERRQTPRDDRYTKQGVCVQHAGARVNVVESRCTMEHDDVRRVLGGDRLFAVNHLIEIPSLRVNSPNNQRSTSAVRLRRVAIMGRVWSY